MDEPHPEAPLLERALQDGGEVPALVHEPPLVICDEPTAALDARNGEVVLELFRSVARSPERAVIIVTHDNRIFSYADRIARMDDGEIIEEKLQVHEQAPHFVHEHAL